MATAVVVAGATFFSAPASQAGQGGQNGPILNQKLVVEAKADECFKTVSDHVEMPNPKNENCPNGYTPKINQSYPWGGAVSGKYAYVGTGANILCSGAQIFGYTGPAYRSGGNACEYELGPEPERERYGDGGADSRTPQILQINANNDKVKDITPKGDDLLQHVSGLRGGFAKDDLVILAGPTLASDGTGKSIGVAAFAFDGKSGKFLGSHLYEDLGNIRVGVKASDGNTYVAARSRDEDDPSAFGGVILKWTGTVKDPFKHEVVGQLPDNEAGYIIEHNRKLVVSGWAYTDPSVPGYPGSVTHGPSKLWASRSLAAGPLTSADAGGWNAFFSYSDYDPDPVIGKALYWGALASWRGGLYVGSYQIDTHGTSILSLWSKYGTPSGTAQKLQDVRNSARPTSVFRIDNPSAPNQSVSLLYGEHKWPVRDAAGNWKKTVNKLGQKPRFGPAGFDGNPYNAYSWTFTVFKDKLYMATADTSGMVSQVAPLSKKILGWGNAFEAFQEHVEGPRLRNKYGGGDLWRMDSPNTPAVAETLDGFGNKSRWGVRIFLPFEDRGFFYAGAGAGDNLRSTGDRGGFGVYKLTPGKVRPPIPSPGPDNGIVFPSFGGA
ncbi:hypothetical protein ACFW96_35745 [Streptomyces gardneri]|uniref:hypothetical protein n=1 Tax=Streptomyces gardneri TaxID=66892 RepID=UPI0036907199